MKNNLYKSSFGLIGCQLWKSLFKSLYSRFDNRTNVSYFPIRAKCIYLKWFITYMTFRKHIYIKVLEKSACYSISYADPGYNSWTFIFISNQLFQVNSCFSPKVKSEKYLGFPYFTFEMHSDRKVTISTFLLFGEWGIKDSNHSCSPSTCLNIDYMPKCTGQNSLYLWVEYATIAMLIVCFYH